MNAFETKDETPQSIVKAGRYYRLFVIVQACALIFLLIVRAAPRESYPRTQSAFGDVNGGLKTALGLFEVDCGRYPTTDEGLKILISPPSDGSLTNWRGPYLDPSSDPWGHPYVYRFPGTHNTNGYDLYSMGPDGAGNTSDDIGNWENPVPAKLAPGRSSFDLSPDKLLPIFPSLFMVGMIAQLVSSNVRALARENSWVDRLWFAIALISLLVLVTPRISG
jgi:general secretion pathway protein G